MRVDRLVLQDFRNYTQAISEFASGLNLVVGRNAQGKTNLLEAVYCLSGMGSPRGNDAAMVRHEAERALLHADVTRGSRTIQVDLEMKPGRGTRALINKTPVPSMASLGEVAVSVFFGPDELSLVKGSPDGRRRFLDDLVVKLRPAREGLRRELERVLRQRNALLKSAPRGRSSSAPSTLEVWDDALSRAGGALAAARLEALAHLLPWALKRFEAIAGGGRMEMAYESSWLPPDVADDALAEPASIDAGRLSASLLTAIESVRPRELERGQSLVGPQRDDVVIRLTSGTEHSAGILDARSFASQGEQRTCALAMKLGEYDLLSDVLDGQPILLLDDVFSELDPSRRAWLGDAVRATGQTIISSAEPDAVQAAGGGHVIEVIDGELRSRG